MNSIITLIATLCQIHSGDPSDVIAKEQMRCQAYYAGCLASSQLGATEISLMACMAARPAAELAEKIKASSRVTKPTNQPPVKIREDQDNAVAAQ